MHVNCSALSVITVSWRKRCVSRNEILESLSFVIMLNSIAHELNAGYNLNFFSAIFLCMVSTV
jgi:hypothetical protein